MAMLCESLEGIDITKVLRVCRSESLLYIAWMYFTVWFIKDSSHFAATIQCTTDCGRHTSTRTPVCLHNRSCRVRYVGELA